jgi:hypothetical protein
VSIRAQISSRPPRPEQQRHECKHSHKPDTASGGRRCVECAGDLEILPLASTVFAPSCEAGAVVQRRDHDTPICSRRLGEQVFLGVRFSPRDLARLALSAVVIVPILPALTADHAQARGGWTRMQGCTVIAKLR